MKKVLFLGAATFQIPPIEYALRKGYEVITTDNQPNNPGHQLAHKQYNISTVDKKKILQLAENEQIDGIVCFGSDVSAMTAAYVSKALKLVGTAPETVAILTNKALFRDFLAKHRLQRELLFRAFTWSEKTTIETYFKKTQLPMVVKPVDASGSKGVSIIKDLKGDWEAKIDGAFEASLSEKIIIEEFVEKKGRQVCGDGYMEAGKLKFVEFGDGHFYSDQRFLAPYAETFPSRHKATNLVKLSAVLERILQTVGYHDGTFNLDAFIQPNDEIFVNEIGPRSGGNYIPSAIKMISNVDLIGAAVERSLNPYYQLSVSKKRSPYYYACYMIHSKYTGLLKSITFAPEIESHIVQNKPYLPINSKVSPFYQANNAIGNLILKFDNEAQMHEKMSCINDYCHVSIT